MVRRRSGLYVPRAASWNAQVLALPNLKWWSKLADASTPFTDDSGGGHTVAFPAGGTAQITGPLSNGDKAFGAGTTNSTTTTASWMDVDGAWWGGWWFKTGTTGSERTVFARGSNTTTYAWSCGISSTNKALIRCRTSFGNTAQGSTTITDNAWHFGFGTWDGSVIKIYVDGTLEATSSSLTGSLPTGTGSFCLGGHGGTRLMTTGDGMAQTMFGGGAAGATLPTATDIANLWAAR